MSSCTRHGDERKGRTSLLNLIDVRLLLRGLCTHLLSTSNRRPVAARKHPRCAICRFDYLQP